nr:DUF3556 domain-containing protein [Williamsia muralis]
MCPPAILFIAIALLIIVGLRDKVIFIAARGEQYLPTTSALVNRAPPPTAMRAPTVDHGRSRRQRAIWARRRGHPRIRRPRCAGRQSCQHHQRRCA